MRKRNFIQANILFLKSVERRLLAKRIRPAFAEAENLVTRLGGISRLDFFTGEKTLSDRARRSVRKAIAARLQGKPLQYILKEAHFFGRVFFVGKNTLIPRPETEILVQETLSVLQRFHPKGGTAPKVLDVGTGCGCIALSLTLERPDCRMTALDASTAALRIVRKNLEFHKLRKKVKLVESDLFSFFGEKEKGHWDLVVSNPPYVPSEDLPRLSREVRADPRLALDGGPGGLQLIRAILEKAPYFLKKNGWLLMEIGKGHSRVLAKRLLKGGIFKNFRFARDLAGIERVLIAQKR